MYQKKKWNSDCTICHGRDEMLVRVDGKLEKRACICVQKRRAKEVAKANENFFKGVVPARKRIAVEAVPETEQVS